ncbi:hypothetical protein [uncultured Bacteroides sp.]|uniref:hypothetical protein n=1 Tax=uncultured Bacteroides sp. TaxID=162156 RepID=UPI0025D60847|nr:hypothetical protein [uncultured Bacteroides sp.]
MLNELSVRFLKVLEYLIDRKYVSDNKDFASKISVSASLITEISKGRSNVGLTAIQNTVLVFPIDSDWLLTGRGCMLRGSEETGNAAGSFQAAYLSAPEGDSFLYRMYKEKDDENKSLIEELGGLKERLRHLESELSQYESQPEKYKERHPVLTSSETVRPVTIK